MKEYFKKIPVLVWLTNIISSIKIIIQYTIGINVKTQDEKGNPIDPPQIVYRAGKGKADIVICDGFTGNIVLKLSEGIIAHLMGWIQERVGVHVPYQDASSIYKPVFDDIAATLDHEEHGATPLLGINGVVMKCHGSSTVRGIKNSLIAAEKTVKENLIKDIATILSKHSNIFDNNTGISEAKPV